MGDSDILADVMGCERDPKGWCQALMSAEFFELVDGCYILHDWMAYFGKVIEQRKANAERQRAWRDRRNTGAVVGLAESEASRNAYLAVTSQ